MQSIPMDDLTLDRLLSGKLDPDDAPPGYAPVTRLLRSAGATIALGARQGSDLPGTASALPAGDPGREAQMIAAMVAAIKSPAGPVVQPKPRRSLRSRIKFGGLVVAGVLFGTTGLAFAGALPGPAQSAASTVLAKVGISVPHGHSKQSLTPTATPSPLATPSQGPDPNGPAKYGLCNAYSNGQGGTNGGKNDSVAFQNLQDAAKAAGQSVEQFCQGATPGGKPQGQNQGKHKGHSKSHGQHGPQAQAHTKGRGRSHPSRAG